MRSQLMQQINIMLSLWYNGQCKHPFFLKYNISDCIFQLFFSVNCMLIQPVKKLISPIVVTKPVPWPNI